MSRKQNINLDLKQIAKEIATGFLIKIGPVPGILVCISVFFFVFASPLYSNSMEYTLLGLAFLAFAVGFHLVFVEGVANKVEQVKKPSLRLMWQHQFQFIGFYEPFTARDIEIKEGGSPFGIEPIATVMEKVDDYGICTCIDLVRRWHSSALFREAEIVPCFVVFKRSPVCIIAREGQNITVDELNGARVAFYGRADSTYREFSVLAEHTGIENIRHIFLEEDAYIQEPLKILLDDKADFRIGYAFNEALKAQIQKGFTWRYMWQVFEAVLYSDALIARYDYVDQNRHIVADIVASVHEAYLFSSKGNNESATWKTLRENCPREHGYSSELMREKNVNPLPFLVGMLSNCLKEIEALKASSYIGEFERWKEMENLLYPKSENKESYAHFLKNRGLFDTFAIRNPYVK